MTIRISCDLDEWFDLLAAHEGPGRETVAAMSSAIERGFVESQALVHVITGSLRASGRTVFRSPASGGAPGEWSGEISYGGSAPGFVHDPVRYAKEEFGKGGSHDALRNVDLLSEDLMDGMFASVRAHVT